MSIKVDPLGARLLPASGGRQLILLLNRSTGSGTHRNSPGLMAASRARQIASRTASIIALLKRSREHPIALFRLDRRRLILEQRRLQDPNDPGGVHGVGLQPLSAEHQRQVGHDDVDVAVALDGAAGRRRSEAR